MKDSCGGRLTRVGGAFVALGILGLTCWSVVDSSGFKDFFDPYNKADIKPPPKAFNKGPEMPIYIQGSVPLEGAFYPCIGDAIEA